jgi:hypothetical protein
LLERPTGVHPLGLAWGWLPEGWQVAQESKEDPCNRWVRTRAFCSFPHFFPQTGVWRTVLPFVGGEPGELLGPHGGLAYQLLVVTFLPGWYWVDINW